MSPSEVRALLNELEDAVRDLLSSTQQLRIELATVRQALDEVLSEMDGKVR
jgi:cell division septum initiation protein DivIVA